jgi:predicted nucleic acid-binding protein
LNGKSWSIRDLESAHQRVVVDANVLIYLLQADEGRGKHAQAVIDAIEQGRLSGVLATVGGLEVLTGPAKANDQAGFERTAEEVWSLPLRVVSLSPTIAEDAAWMRGSDGLRMADAIHLATARADGATALVTNDRRIQSRHGLDVFYLDDLVLVG